ncbi:WD40-repeat-containing domain protein [Lineolata rhizophorae]|uniref:WD40-repeat-containing domain protein n=1 Tax=Lineolata rhizophorae TaxID=578093 RepID=A0A6A6NQE0_9PEZI|nr:WD40-repeat-containing domain protein [Lineolata rhizophorae]
MATFDDDDANSPDTSSEPEAEADVDETMEDVDAMDQDGDEENDQDLDDQGDGDGDEDGDDDNENGDNEDDDEDRDDDRDDDMESPSQRNSRPRTPVRQNGVRQSPSARREAGGARGANDLSSFSGPTISFTSPSPRPSSAAAAAAAAVADLAPWRPAVRKEALTASLYDIVPTIAAPHSTSINAITATPDMRWVFSGGTDGYIRKFNWIDTVNGKMMLTVAQRHPFVDSVTKAGVLMSYWENEDGPGDMDDNVVPSPVYSLAVQHQGLWLLSGLESGGINLQSVRHEEGKRLHCLRKHTSAVSVLTLAHDERSVLSGSWDKMIHDWDLNTGQIRRSFDSSSSQISAIEMRPISSLPVPEDSDLFPATNGTFSSNNAAPPTTNGVLPNGVGPASNSRGEGTGDGGSAAGGGGAGAGGSPTDSLFGDNGDKDSLFGGDDDAANASVPTFGDDEDDEFSRAIANGLQQQEEDDAEAEAEAEMMDVSGGPVQPPNGENGAGDMPGETDQAGTAGGQSAETAGSETLVNGVDDMPNGVVFDADANLPSSETTFLDAAINGTLRIWDRRQARPVASIMPQRGVPPWCMNACWSPDGNFIYAGRRNGTVEEYSLHRSLKEPRRTFRFPTGSGPVSALKPMPNGRHLVCASYDILRLYDLREPEITRHSAVPFLIVPGHRTGVVSQLYIDPTCTFMISIAGNRGWEGSSTEVLLGYEIGVTK